MSTLPFGEIQHWSDAVRHCEVAGTPYVIATVLGASGSTPRDSGTKMVFWDDNRAGTLGGGQLEFSVTQHALDLLAERRPAQYLENYPLGARLGQCCGGSAAVLLESFVPTVRPTYLFGAGHVGRALAPILASLPLTLHWVDSRREEFPAVVPSGVQRWLTDDPLACLTSALPGSAYLIMTHQHVLDFELLLAALRRGDASYIGVIGSQSKWRRFRERLRQRGISDADCDSVHCPIGLSAVPGKQPAEIAVSVAAQLIAHYHAQQGDHAVSGPRWKAVTATLEASGALADLTRDAPP